MVVRMLLHRARGVCFESAKSINVDLEMICHYHEEDECHLYMARDSWCLLKLIHCEGENVVDYIITYELSF